MTYRCADCVYSEPTDNLCEMKCIKHDGEIVKCMNNHCDDLILRPFQFISHLCFVTNRKGSEEYSWSDAEKLAIHLLENMGFAGMTLPEKLYLFRNSSGKRPDYEEIKNGGL